MVASYVVSALNILAGILCITTAPLSAAICITIGILSVANSLFSQLDGWDWIAQKFSNGDKEKEIFLKNILPQIVSLLLMGANLGGAFFLGAQQGLGLMQLVKDASSTGMKAALLAPSFIQGGSQMMKGVYEGKSIYQGSLIEELNFKLRCSQELFRSLTKDSEHSKQTNREAQRLLKEIALLSMEMQKYSLTHQAG